MKRRYHILFGLLGLYSIGLGWGYLRLPWAAINCLSDFKMLGQAPVVRLRSGGVSVAPVQRWYLRQVLPDSATGNAPVISVEVKWSALVCARVHSALYMSPDGAEVRDSLYVCLFGAWIPVHTYMHVMACAPLWHGNNPVCEWGQLTCGQRQRG